MNAPVRGAEYTAREVLGLELRDCPFFRFCVNGRIEVIQTSHLTEAELLSVPGFADTRWRYQRETREWIPLFMAVNDDAVAACVDMEPDRSPYNDQPALWVTPKGFPRKQYSYA